jgi:hypothetical protein
MSRFFTGIRFVTAVLSLIAVVFAVMEHEDLLLQSRWAANAPTHSRDTHARMADGAAQKNNGISAATLTTAERDSGTQGVFRQDSYKLRAAPVAPQLPRLRVGLLRSYPSIAEAALRRAFFTPACLVGVVELRL